MTTTARWQQLHDEQTKRQAELDATRLVEFTSPTHPMGTVAQLLEAHNESVKTIKALIRYVNLLEIRISELDGPQDQSKLTEDLGAALRRMRL